MTHTWTVTTKTTLEDHLGLPGTVSTARSDQELINRLAKAMRRGQRGNITYTPTQSMKPAALKRLTNKIEEEAHRQALS